MTINEALRILEDNLEGLDDDSIFTDEGWKAQQRLITYVRHLEAENRKLREDIGLWHCTKLNSNT